MHEISHTVIVGHHNFLKFEHKMIM